MQPTSTSTTASSSSKIPTIKGNATIDEVGDIVYKTYEGEHELPLLTALIEKDLSEPYSVFTYRYFINNWPDLCLLAMKGKECVGTIVCKLSEDKDKRNRGYIAMLAVEKQHRKRGIGSHLVVLAVKKMIQLKTDLVVLETEITNKAALSLYENLDFARDKRLHKYYMNGVDAFRLKLWLTPPPQQPPPQQPPPQQEEAQQQSQQSQQQPLQPPQQQPLQPPQQQPLQPPQQQPPQQPQQQPQQPPQQQG